MESHVVWKLPTYHVGNGYGYGTVLGGRWTMDTEDGSRGSFRTPNAEWLWIRKAVTW